MSINNNDNNKKVILPEFDEAVIVATNPKASAEELSKIKTEYAEQLLINEARRAELKGTLQPNPSRTYTTVDAVVGEGHMFGTTKGSVHDPPNLKDKNSTVFTRFQTLAANQSIWAACQMSSDKAGTVWVNAKLGPNAGPDNYVVVYKATWLNPIPTLIGSIKVTQPNSATKAQTYVIGTTEADYKYLIVGTASTNPTTTPSEILIDTIGVDY
ncbi:MAG: hypothetical protein LBH62_02570 [Nitrososphaerota archaeon]|nr:hypothetical protein [Nitrososphaerota archaeon]